MNCALDQGRKGAGRVSWTQTSDRRDDQLRSEEWGSSRSPHDSEPLNPILSPVALELLPPLVSGSWEIGVLLSFPWKGMPGTHLRGEMIARPERE